MEAPDDQPGSRRTGREVIPGPRRRPAGRRRPLRRSPGGLRARGRRDPDAGDRRRHRRLHPGGAARVALHGVGRGQPRVRLHHPPLRVHLAGHPPVGLRPRPRLRAAHAAQAPAGARRLRPRPLPDRAALGRGRRRDRGADLAGLPARPGGRPRRPHRAGAVPALRLRLLRGRRWTRPSPRSA